MYCTDMVSNAVKLEDEGQPQAAHSGNGIGADAYWL